MEPAIALLALGLLGLLIDAIITSTLLRVMGMSFLLGAGILTLWDIVVRKVGSDAGG